MKATGIVRRIDDLGRVVIPKELRNAFGINDGDPMEIFVDKEGEIILRKYHPGCMICGNMDDISSVVPGKYICKDCVRLIKAV